MPNNIEEVLTRLSQKTKRLNDLGAKPMTPSTPEIEPEQKNPSRRDNAKRLKGNFKNHTEGYIIRDGKRYKEILVEICPSCNLPKGMRALGECKCGRPRLYENEEALWAKCVEYFNDCRNPQPIEQEVEELDKKTGKVRKKKVWVQREQQNIILTGLIVHLGLVWETWYEYEGDPRFAEVVKKARFTVESEYEKRLNKYNGQVAGPLFIMKNKFGYKDQQEVLNRNVNINDVIDKINGTQKQIEAEGTVVDDLLL